MSADASNVIGVLALQGSFQEHCHALRRAGATPLEVRKAEQLAGLAGLIIPGGESTTMALVAERWGLVEPLRQFATSGRPIWGTCAGLIFLANQAVGQKEGGQALIGGLDVTVSRNFFGSQIDSFEIELDTQGALFAAPAPAAAGGAAGRDRFRAVFIRAPAVLRTGSGVEVLASLPVADRVRAGGGAGAADAPASVAVAVRQGRLMGTAFHPELTGDDRWHELFVRMCREVVPSGAAAPAPAAPAAEEHPSIRRALPLPVFGPESTAAQPARQQ